MNDAELLRYYASTGSETAFRELVDRHLPLVYSAAVRQVGDPALSEDIAQVVFTALARRAGALSSRTVLTGWLFRTTRHIAIKAIRRERRRRRREQEALQMQRIEAEDLWEQMAPRLDEALAKLGEVERTAVLLHYFEHKRLREVGTVLGLSEDAAQKRVSRALEKLRKLLLKRHVAVPLAVIPGLLMTHGAPAAPALLASSVVSSALGQTPAPSILEAAFLETPWAKVAPALPKAAALLITIGLGVYIWQHWPKQTEHDATAYSFRTQVVMGHRGEFAPTARADVSAPAAGTSAVTVVSTMTIPPPILPQAAKPPPVKLSAVQSAPAKVEPTDEWGPIIAAMAREAPVRPFMAPPPAVWHARSARNHPVAWNYPVAGWNQPVYVGRAAKLTLPEHLRAPTQPRAAYQPSSPWMPYQRPALPPSSAPDSKKSSRKRP